jgi:hypothetical protein
MNDDNGLDPVARLRAADPAVDVEPSEGFTEEVVARVTTDATADLKTPSTPVADLTSERTRRRPRWLPMVAVAASIAIIGAAGYGLGASTGGAANLAEGAAAPISLQTGATQEGAVQGGEAAPGAGFGADQKMAGPGPIADSMMMPYPYGFGRNSFTSSGLATAEGTALAYTYDTRTAASAETVTALAAALGVEGATELKDGSWLVGSQDGTAPYVSVSLDGTLGFSYWNPQIDPWKCVEGTDVDVPCEPTGAVPSETAAIDALRSLIVSVGRDPGAFEFTSETWEGAVTRMAQAWPVVDGQRIDQAWSLELTDAGVSSAYGTLAPIVSLGEYAVVSEQEGFERLSDPRFGAQMTIMPLAMREQPAVATEEWVPPTEPPATPTDGTSVSWPVNDVEIVSARLGLASQWQPDGSVLIVPAYEFTDSDGGAWSVIAVADAMLDFETH